MRTRNNARANYATESFDDKIGGQVSRASGIYFTRKCPDGDRALPRSPISRKLLRSSWSRERDIVATRSRRKRRIIYLHPRFPDESVSLHDKILLRFEYTSKCVTAVLLARRISCLLLCCGGESSLPKKYQWNLRYVHRACVKLKAFHCRRRSHMLVVQTRGLRRATSSIVPG